MCKISPRKLCRQQPCSQPTNNHTTNNHNQPPPSQLVVAKVEVAQLKLLGELRVNFVVGGGGVLRLGGGDVVLVVGVVFFACDDGCCFLMWATSVHVFFRFVCVWWLCGRACRSMWRKCGPMCVALCFVKNSYWT